MDYENNRQLIIRAIETLNHCYLDGLDDQVSYSYDHRYELQQKLKVRFEELRASGVTQLNSKPFSCKCYPKGESFIFYDSQTQNEILRIFIWRKTENFLYVGECHNQPFREGYTELFD
ncbi:MAG: hypothetical protein Tsb004_20700 [Allomuricauda sp.]